MLSFGGSVTKQDGRLVVRSGFVGAALTLGAFRMTASFDPGDRTVRITRRRFWAARRRRIGFDMVEALTYGYENVALLPGLSYGHRAIDLFAVGLRLLDREEIALASFAGPGAFVNDGPLPDWMFWDEFAFDHVGNQESRARAVVDVMSAMIGVPVVPPG